MIIQSTSLPLQVAIRETINRTIAEVVAYLPTIVGALLILVVGYVVGRILGGLVARIVRRIGIDRYTTGTAVEDVGSGDDVARTLGKVVAYYVYFVAIVAAADVLNIDLLTDLLVELGAYLPVILGALVVLLVGFIIGRIVGDIVAGIVGSFGVGPYLRETPLESLGDTEGEFGRIVGKLVTYYVYLLTLLAVADILRIDSLSMVLNEFADYLPALFGGLLVLLVGIWAAERIGGLVDDIDDGRAIHVASLAVKVLVYYITVTVALGAIGFTIAPLTSLFTTFIVAFFGALALALALGIGLAVGLGGQDYVAENIDGWVESARETAGSEDITDR
ncbi:mechanosensitive ion channel family protein [Halorarum halobium]|uniref:mechanosensitive ion channel family protein n=1 Tax=Halorarum halobium TaxID=3075121 RepID=UPI0028A8B567|nr:hypothetical protein [Halobaculum sp. XH14]